MKNTIILVGILALLIGVYVIFVHDFGGSSYDKEDTAFSIADTGAISKIIIQKYIREEPADRIELERTTGGTWTVNERFIAMTPKVRDLLNVMHKLVVKETMNEAGQQTALDRLKKNRTEVLVYNFDGKVMKSYSIGPQNQAQTGNVMLLRGAEHPFVMAKPGLQEGYISIYFNTILDNWRENLVLNVYAEELAAVSVQYADPALSFNLSRNNPESPWLLNESQPADGEKAAAYLANFNGKIFAESFANNYREGLADSLDRRPPDATFSYGTFDGAGGRVRLYAREENPNNFFALIDGRDDLVTIQHFVFDKFLRTAKDFAAPEL